MLETTNPTQNFAEFSFENLVAIFGVQSFVNVPQNSLYIGVSTDTRSIQQGNIFIALIGEVFDAHTKIADAFDNGAALCIVEKSWFESNADYFPGKSFIVVENTLSSLAELAHYHRKRFHLPIVAVVGSNGKTTTKELIASVLSSKGKILKTYGNYNNQVGVPLMLLMLDDSYKYAVLEIGTNEPGEVLLLSKVANPTQAIITNIGLEHLEKLIDIDGVEMEETSIIAHLLRHHGFAYLNCDDPRLGKYAQLIEKNMTYGFGTEFAVNGSVEYDSELKPIIKVKIEETEFTVTSNIIGYAGAINSLGAIAVGIHNEVITDDIISSINNFKPLQGTGYARMALEQLSGFTLLNDCYNANPSSMEMALKTIENLQSNGRKIAVLGEMRELGEASAESHLSILALAEKVCDMVYTFGIDFTTAAKELKGKTEAFDSKDELILHLKNNIKANDFILVKGSRGCRMEEVVLALRAITN